ncbi:DeoR family transcriptional regulator [Anderseniella sp. Alg231-50]|uniref:DeoR family transcriptional regulator n=1 Tax=Anderseniella sp. Alg231-50 TaxID=1922226 RepID=UPI000D55A1A8
MENTASGQGKKFDRQQLLLSVIRQNPGILIRDLAKQLAVSRETIRRDFDELCDAGVLERRYGGANAIGPGNALSFDLRQQQHVPERRRIARATVDMVEAGQVIMLAPGTTALIFAETLAAADKPLTVITNGLREAHTLSEAESIRVIMAPGDVDGREGFVWGHDTTTFLSGYSADLAVFFADALNVNGVFESDPRTAAVVRSMIAHSNANMLLMDHNRFDKQALQLICPIDRIGTLVSDEGPAGALADALATRTRVTGSAMPR